MIDQVTDKCCMTCVHSYDFWDDGTCKCSAAHGGITYATKVCKVWSDGSD